MTDSSALEIDRRRLVRRDERIAWALLAVTSIAFLAYSAAFVPRLTNVHFGDVEFTGWSGPMGSRLLRGDRPYIDFVLPIPPGSFLLVALLEKMQGRPLLLDELWLNSVIHLGMALLAYSMARTITSPKNAAATAVATLATVIQLNKECAYDHTAQITAWASVACGLHALTSSDEKRRVRLWMLTGFFAGATLAFKQSTAMGCIGGWFVAIGYLSAVELWSKERDRARAWVGPLVHYSQGVGLGLALVWLLLIAVGSTARAFFQAVFLDASILKGGPRFLAQHLLEYLFDYPAYPASLALIVVFVLVGFRLVRLRGGVAIGSDGQRSSPYRTWEVAYTAALVLSAFGGGILILTKGPAGYPNEWIREIDRLKQIPALGLIPTSAAFVSHLVRVGPVPARGSPDPARAGHAFNAAMIAAFACTLMHNTSAPEFRPYYDNNAIIPLTLASLFIGLDRADLRWLGALLLFFILVSVGGNKFFRAMTATSPASPSGQWAGMRLTVHGVEVELAAARVRELAGADDSVLVLPEDEEITGLIGRRRPPLLGAIVFVDQYAPRLAKNDMARLDENLPKVIVIHPRQPRGWERFFRIWSGRSGAEEVLRHVLDHVLPKRYALDSSFPTAFLYGPGTLDVYVRKDEADVRPPDEDGNAHSTGDASKDVPP